MKRSVFFVSDGTGITAENLGQSLLTQFDQILFEKKSFPYVNSIEKAKLVVAAIVECHNTDQQKPLVFSTLVNEEIHDFIANSPCLLLDFFKAFINPLENELQIKSSHKIGKRYGVSSTQNYTQRIDAVNYAIMNDDGMNIDHFDEADFILIGVSRCGKTPTCLYSALQFGMYAANYPLTAEDVDKHYLPKCLQSYKNKLFGLIIDPHRLSQIRAERKPNSHYASLNQCQRELNLVSKLFKQENISYIDTTTRSIEEIATEILSVTGLKKRV